MNNDKINKRITIAIIVSFAVILFLCIFIVPFVVDYIKGNRISNEIYNSLINYKHSSKVVYYNWDTIYYNGEHTRFDGNINIRYVDDNNIIRYNYRTEEMFLVRGANCLDLTKINGEYYDFFVKNDFIYSKNYDESCYMYDIEKDSLSKISQEEYDCERYGSKKSISLKNNNIKCIDNDTRREINISTDIIIKENLFSNIANFNMFRIKDYQIHNDDLFIRLHYLEYEIITKYDFINNQFELYDWFHCGYDIKRFNILNEEYPVSLERYFMVDSYE